MYFSFCCCHSAKISSSSASCSRSRRYISGKLYERGVSEEVVKQAFAEAESELSEGGADSEELKFAALDKQIEKSLKNIEAEDRDALTKAMQSLMRKGFPYSDIRQRIDIYYKNRQE